MIGHHLLIVMSLQALKREMFRLTSSTHYGVGRALPSCIAAPFARA